MGNLNTHIVIINDSCNFIDDIADSIEKGSNPENVLELETNKC